MKRFWHCLSVMAIGAWASSALAANPTVVGELHVVAPAQQERLDQLLARLKREQQV